VSRRDYGDGVLAHVNAQGKALLIDVGESLLEKCGVAVGNVQKDTIVTRLFHFRIDGSGHHVPEGEVYVATESPRGELGFYVMADGSGKPLIPNEVVHCLIQHLILLMMASRSICQTRVSRLMCLAEHTNISSNSLLTMQGLMAGEFFTPPEVLIRWFASLNRLLAIQSMTLPQAAAVCWFIQLITCESKDITPLQLSILPKR